MTLSDSHQPFLKQPKPQEVKWSLAKWIVIIMISGALVVIHFSTLPASFDPSVDSFTCPQQLQWDGSANKTLDVRFKHHFDHQNFIHSVTKRFSGAIQIPTVSFDEMRGGPKGSPAQDVELHKPFLEFHQYLEQAYPFTHELLEKIVINDYSILYKWAGSDESLKPGMLMAHIDVVPVDPNTVSDWKNPPFSGFVNEDEGKIYGWWPSHYLGLSVSNNN